MNFNNLKRNTFFWIEKLQISRSERIGITILIGILVVLFSMNYFLGSTFNYNQQRYDEITAEFERRSQILHQEKKELAEKYNPELAVSELPSAESGQTAKEFSGYSEKININTAGSAELQTLDGIGEAYAKRIIEYREANGGFDSIDELVNVRGIGKTRLENIRPYITLEN